MAAPQLPSARGGRSKPKRRAMRVAYDVAYSTTAYIGAADSNIAYVGAASSIIAYDGAASSKVANDVADVGGP